MFQKLRYLPCLQRMMESSRMNTKFVKHRQHALKIFRFVTVHIDVELPFQKCEKGLKLKRVRSFPFGLKEI